MTGAMLPEDLVEREALLTRLGRRLRGACPKGDGFALFIGDELGGYLSNADREDIVRSVRMWLDHARARMREGQAPDPEETANGRVMGKATELVAVELAKVVRRTIPPPPPPYIVFAFSFRPGSWGWRSSGKDDHRAVVQVIERFIAAFGQRS